MNEIIEKVTINKEDKKTVVLTTRQILLYLADFVVGMNQVFDRHGMYRKNIKDYWNWRQIDKARFSKDLYRLKKEKIVKERKHIFVSKSVVFILI